MKDRGGFPAVVCPRCSRLQGRTGRAQANGLSGPTTNAELARQRVDHDLVYIERVELLVGSWRSVLFNRRL
jgi:hypothetical protein